MKEFIIVGFGGFSGSVLRYLVQKLYITHTTSAFPWSTLIVNLAGSLFIGVIYGLAERYNLFTLEWRLFLATGFCGGFTTFSAFSNDGLILLRDGNYLYFLVYVFTSVIIGLLLAFLGYLLFKHV
jgi:CrcB protein